MKNRNICAKSFVILSEALLFWVVFLSFVFHLWWVLFVFYLFCYLKHVCVCEKYFLLPTSYLLFFEGIRSDLVYNSIKCKSIWPEWGLLKWHWLLQAHRPESCVFGLAPTWISCYTALHGIIPLWASVLNTADHKIPFHFCCINTGSQIAWLFLAASGILAKGKM